MVSVFTFAIVFAGSGAALAAPQSIPVQEKNARAVKAWEDAILLEAIRYLNLKSAQLKELSDISETTDKVIISLHEQESGILASMGRLASSQREALVAGRAPAIDEQREGVELGKKLQRQRAYTEDEILRIALPRMRSILKPDQLYRIYLLTHSEWPPNETRSPLLLDPASGFVQDTQIQILQSRLDEAQMLFQRALDEQLPPEATQKDREGFAAMQADQKANLLRAQQEMARFKGTALERARRAGREASDPELVSALRSFVKRIFTSDRIKPALQDRLKNQQP